MPFLDLKIIRKNNKLEFGIFRKATNVDRFITNESYYHSAHKHAAFNCFVFRLCSLPLSQENYKRKIDFIKFLADVNGFSNELINDLVRKHKR